MNTILEIKFYETPKLEFFYFSTPIRKITLFFFVANKNTKHLISSFSFHSQSIFNGDLKKRSSHSFIIFLFLKSSSFNLILLTMISFKRSSSYISYFLSIQLYFLSLNLYIFIFNFFHSNILMYKLNIIFYLIIINLI